MSEKNKPLMVKCPNCKTAAPWTNNPYRPFCSERCKLIDLGNWADGTYNIEGVEPPDFSDDGQNGPLPTG